MRYRTVALIGVLVLSGCSREWRSWGECHNKHAELVLRKRNVGLFGKAPGLWITPELSIAIEEACRLSVERGRIKCVFTA